MQNVLWQILGDLDPTLPSAKFSKIKTLTFRLREHKIRVPPTPPGRTFHPIDTGSARGLD